MADRLFTRTLLDCDGLPLLREGQIWRVVRISASFDADIGAWIYWPSNGKSTHQLLVLTCSFSDSPGERPKSKLHHDLKKEEVFDIVISATPIKTDCSSC